LKLPRYKIELSMGNTKHIAGFQQEEALAVNVPEFSLREFQDVKRTGVYVLKETAKLHIQTRLRPYWSRA
jgi:hypothetical protein